MVEDIVCDAFLGIGLQVCTTPDTCEVSGGHINMTEITADGQFSEIAGIGDSRTGIDIVNTIGLIGIVILSDVTGVEMTGQNEVDTTLHQARADSRIVLDDRRRQEMVDASNMFHERVMHHGNHLITFFLCLNDLITKPFECTAADLPCIGIDA
mgnify:CR=1 FL=1